MTKDDILKMNPGKEFDNLLALNVMNYTPASHNWWLPQHGGKFNCPVAEATEWLYEGKNGVERNGKRYYGMPTYMFNPSTNIEIAWEVVRKLKSKRHFVIRELGGYWEASFTVNGYGPCGTGSTASEAICKAALLAVTEDN